VDERESLGKYLKRERENRKISLKEVSKQIKVREPFLKAVEEDRRELLPSVTYVKGFLSAYAKYLGLDPNEVILRYEAESQGEPIIRPEAVPEKRMLRSPKVLWVIGGVIIVGFVVLYLLLSPSQPPVVPFPPKPEAKKTIPHAPPPPVSEAPSAPEEKEMILQIRAVERTWVAMQIDGQPVREATFQPGESFTYRAARQIQLILGNAGGLEMTFNERRLEKIGKSGEVFDVTFTPQGVEAKRREMSELGQE
jgi:transcriptional regulator with XRE-family HTH domain